MHPIWSQFSKGLLSEEQIELCRQHLGEHPRDENWSELQRMLKELDLQHLDVSPVRARPPASARLRVRSPARPLAPASARLRGLQHGLQP